MLPQKKFMQGLKNLLYRDNKVKWITLVGHVQRVEGNRIPKRVLYMNFRKTRLER